LSLKHNGKSGTTTEHDKTYPESRLPQWTVRQVYVDSYVRYPISVIHVFFLNLSLLEKKIHSGIATARVKVMGKIKIV